MGAVNQKVGVGVGRESFVCIYLRYIKYGKGDGMVWYIFFSRFQVYN